MCLVVLIGVFKSTKSKETLPTTMYDEEKDELMEKAHNTILLYLGNKVFHKVVKNDTTVKLWLKLTNLYMMKSLTNHFYLENQLFHSRYKKELK